MATQRDRRAARAKPSPAALSRDLAASRERILGLEDRLSAAFEKVFRQAGRAAARKFRQKATAHAVTAAAPSPEGTMVAVYPTAEQAAALAQEGGEPAEILHITLAYLGKTTPEEFDAALGPVRDVAASQPAAPLRGEVVGVSTFNPSEDGEGEPLYPSIALPDVLGLAELRAAVCGALDAAGIWYSTDHEWTPHITISYQAEAIPPPRELIGQPLTFEGLTLARGDVPTDLPFGRGALTAAAWNPPDPDEVVDVDAIVSQFHTKADPIRRSAIREYGAALEGIADWDVTNPLAAGVLAGAAQHVTDIADTTRLNVMRTIHASYESGLTIDETAKAIQAGMAAASAARGRLIARTELAAVANGGSLAATQIFADATGGTLYKRWLTAPGAREPRHEDYEGLDGQTVGLDDAFDVGGFHLQFPGDPDGPPEEVCNCRCALIYVGDPGEEVLPAGPPPDPVDEGLSTIFDVVDAVPIAEAGIEAAASEEMSVVLSGDATTTQAALRSGDLSEQLTADLKKVDTAIGGAALDRGAVTLRGVRDMKPMFREGWPPKVGDVAYDPAYASTTTDPKIAAQFAGNGHDAGYVTYHSAPGQNGLWVPGIAPADLSESELLLPRGLPLRVIGVGERDGFPDIHVEIVGRPVTPGLADYGKLAEVGLEPLTGATPYSLAGPVIRNAARSEAEVTAALTDVVGKQGGSFEGLPFKVKSAPSVARKIEKIMGQGVPLQAAASGIKDGLRYTAIFEPDQYVSRMTAVLDDLKAKAGIVPERISATWQPGVEYAGTNMVMRAPNGLRFELQFHTPESFDVKEHVNHGFYQRQRRLEEGSPEWKALAETMLKNANAVERPPGILEWRYEASIEADIGITPFRSASDDPFGFYDTARFKTFERHAEKIASSYGVEIDAKLKVPSVWEGVEEPGVSIHARDGEKGVAAFAADLGKVYDQDAVLLFSPTIGEDIVATFDRTELAPFQVADAMKRAGLPGGRFLEDGRLQIIGSGPEFVAQLDAVARDLARDTPGLGYDSSLGRFTLLQKANGDYETALRDFAGAQGQPLRPPAAAVGEHGGPPPVGPGAPGGQGAAPQAVAALAQAPLPHVPHWSLAEVKAMGDDELWGALGINGKIENLARADVTAVESRRLRAEVWRRAELDRRFMEGVAPDPGLSLRYTDLAGDNQLHSTFSDGHDTIRQMALAAMKRGQKQMVVSDHAHLMTPADVARQHRQIDKLNRELAGKFRILKGIEANILEDGTLDVMALQPDVLASFDVVNAAIHGTEAAGGQQVIFARPATERLLNALDQPRLTVLVHPHAAKADWDAVAAKAAERHVALEVNGRSLLREDSEDQAALMIRAAKKHGAKLAIGSDAHNAGDLADLLYAARFAAENGVTAQDLVAMQRSGGLGIVDASTTLPGDGEITLGRIGSQRLGGGMNVVWKVERDGEYLTVKPEPTENLADLGFDSGNPIRENVEMGRDLERERAAYVFSRYFNEAGGDNYHVNVPPYRISTIIQPNALDRAEVRAGIYPFIEGDVPAHSGTYWEGEISDQDLRSAGLFDNLIGNTDRHGGNFVLGEDGHLWLIDHGNAFPSGYGNPDYENGIIADRARAVLKNRLTPNEVSFLEELQVQWPEISGDLEDSGLSPHELLEMKDRLDFMVEAKERLYGSGSSRQDRQEPASFPVGLNRRERQRGLHRDTDGNLRNADDELVDSDGNPLS